MFQRFALIVLLSFAALLAAGSAWSQADPKDEARQRFDRGLKLFDQGDDAGALAEFQRTYEMFPHPLVLYNIGLVQAAMKRPVEAVDSLDALLAAPGSLSSDKLARARQLRAEQAARIGEIVVHTNVPAVLEVDGVQRGKSGDKPLKVSHGSHIVGAIAAGRIPVRREVLVPSAGRTEVELELLPADGRLAALKISCSVPGVRVSVDGQRFATTPLPGPLSLNPGDHRVELEREGYTAFSRQLTLGSGTESQLDVELAVVPSQLGKSGGTLKLIVSEPDATLFIDGAPAALSPGGVRLPHGPHLIRVERSGFLPFERQVEVARGGETNVPIELEPTADTRAAYRSRTTGQRTWGWVAVGSGALIAASGGGFVIWNKTKENAASDDFDREAARNGPGGDCDASTGKQTSACIERFGQALDELESVRAREKYGWVALGTGVAISGVGVALLLLNDDPDRYEPRPDSNVFGALRVSPTAWTLPGGAGAGVAGSF